MIMIKQDVITFDTFRIDCGNWDRVRGSAELQCEIAASRAAVNQLHSNCKSHSVAAKYHSPTQRVLLKRNVAKARVKMHSPEVQKMVLNSGFDWSKYR